MEEIGKIIGSKENGEKMTHGKYYDSDVYLFRSLVNTLFEADVESEFPPSTPGTWLSVSILQEEKIDYMCPDGPMRAMILVVFSPPTCTSYFC